ncbi:MAG TPA: UvrD-helicase domain-containing protein [Planctomycetota bacterium]|nr:UvrD-helicase domain-containing protein [Planctomycetota bacterium]
MSTNSDILADLTPEQREAVTHLDGPLLVVAGAGSGKTRVITRRVAHLALQGVPARRLLAVTFTNKAADEMRERIEQLAGTGGAWVSTFHSLCASMLRISADQAGLSRNFTIYDRDDQLAAVGEALKLLELGREQLPPASVLQTISNAKTRLESPKDFAKRATAWRDELLAKVYAKYQEILDRNAALDFDDLLMRAALLLQHHDAFRERWQKRFQYVLIDEYQDTNHAQYLIARELAAAHRNLCATGDPDQAIYSWRGATIRNILEFKRDYPDACVVKLERNYRSTKTILRAADSLIVHNRQRHERGLWTENDEGVPVSFLLADDAEDEAAQVVRTIRARHKAGHPWRDMAIFYRTNAQSRSFEETMRHAIPHRLIGAVQFYGRQEIKDVVAYLRACVNERDDLSLARIINVPARGIGGRTVERLKQWAAEQGISLRGAVPRVEEIPGLATRAKNVVKAFADLLDAFLLTPKKPVFAFCASLLQTSGYQAWLEQPENKERLENVTEFLAKAAKFDQVEPEGDLATFMQGVALVSDVDNLDRSADAVTLMTLHAAKGLEFPIVFLTGLEENLLPHYNAMHSPEQVEEERRLCYVGMTRAKQELVLSAAQWRAQGGSNWEREPSRFLCELQADVLDKAGRRALATVGPVGKGDEFAGDEEAEAPALAARLRPRKPRASQPSPQRPRTERGGLAVGDRVRHPQFGEGRIVTLQRSEKLTLATVAMQGGGKRVFALEYVQLEKL